MSTNYNKMTSPFFQLDKKERMLPDTPYYQPPQQQTGLNIPTSEPSPFNNAFFSSSSAPAQPATRTCATTRTPSHCSTSSSCSSTSRNARAEDKAAYKAQKRILKDQANHAKQQARSDAKQLKAERSLTQRQEKDLRHEIKHQAKQFKHEIKHQCKELKKELKHQHHAHKYGRQSYAVPSVPSVPGAPSVPSYASPPSQLVQSQPYGFYPQPVPVLVSSPLNQDLTVYDCSRGRTRYGQHYRHHTHHHNGGPHPVRLVHSVISRALTGVSNHLEQQVRHLQQERQQHEQQRTTVTVAPAPLLATSTSTPVMQYRPPAGPPPAPVVSGGDSKVGLQDPMLVYSMSNMSLGSSSSSSPASSSSSRPLPAMPVPHAIPRPDLVQQDQEQEEEDNAVPPPSYEDSFSTRRA
ncbi:hypothetical protein KI688_004023 [Linnemannia hyalina]|uniref:Uncharacterized protein n=1 Tax=Linnemannia hyalina TaxID=64524 RepID=A0A9P8BPK6_9FUNG|nr:hypothetical protein KI688_004023 [Linnemannia hyalina]